MKTITTLCLLLFNGASVPGAEIKVTNAATNVTLTNTSNEQGNYEALYLQPGFYSVRVTATGICVRIWKSASATAST